MHTIAHALHAAGLIGDERKPWLFSTGPEYLNLITYLGCSPHIALGENEGATTIRLGGIFDAPQFVRGENLKLPRCPRCRKVLENAEISDSPDVSLYCKCCGYGSSIHDFDWRHSAAFGRIFIEISNVFESEAVPGEELAGCLNQATGEVWDYSYIRRNGN